jgi:phage repressor protein C with HTH and peptisase S24 domain
MNASALNALGGLIHSMALRERIKEVMGETSPADFAREMGVTDATVHFWLKGKTLSIKGENAAAIEKKRGYRAKWVIDGTPPKRVIDKSQPDEPTPEYAGARTLNVRKVVVVGTARLSEGEEGFYDEISSTPGAGDGHMEIATGDPNAYGLRVRGNSMAPAIRDGWYVLVEPNSAPAVGEYVLVKLRNGQKMVKELLYRRAESIEVLSVNNGMRRTIYTEEIESLQAVAAVVPPSKWKPD